jgi:hypothetical protein
MTGMICVLTGDIVGSTQLGRGKLDQLMTGLAEGANEIRHWTKPAALPLERFRGDGWQFALIDAAYALRAGLVLRAIVKKLNQEADTKIAFGIGKGEFGSTLADSGGYAFEVSGMRLEEFKSQDRWIVDGEFDSEQVLPLVRGLFAACEGLSSGWTSKQAEVFVRLATPEKPKYAQVAEALQVSAQTVQEHFARSGGRSLLQAIHRFEDAFGEKSG